MKSTVKKLLALLLLTLICLAAVSCGVETTSAYTTLHDHLNEKVGVGKPIRLPCEDESVIPFVYIEENDSGEEVLYLSIQAQTNGQGYRMDIKFEPGSPDSLTWIYRQVSGQDVTARAESKIDLRSYNGTDLIAFDSSVGFPLSELTYYRVYATDLTNAALLALDQYCAENLDMSVTDLGFVSLADSFLHADQAKDDFSELGGAFSGARLSYALRMTLLGMVMIFAVLGLLWAILALFKKVFTSEPASKKAPAKSTQTPAPAPTPTTAPAPADTPDAATVAAITAAIAAMIDSDPALSAQFAGGFRVVSFKKKSGKTAWNR